MFLKTNIDKRYILKIINYINFFPLVITFPALGPDSYGCRMPCHESAYGCCEDDVTPAHGPNSEGCCLSTPYKCCPDNILPARGPNFYGCGCQYTRFGCCPDNSTVARGPNNEGCGCQYTTHGCCPNRFTPASGPHFEGCPCYTYQFGCCPDGVTIAKGSHGQGNQYAFKIKSLKMIRFLKGNVKNSFGLLTSHDVVLCLVCILPSSSIVLP